MYESVRTREEEAHAFARTAARDTFTIHGHRKSLR